jgi:hypothetical protein
MIILEEAIKSRGGSGLIFAGSGRAQDSVGLKNSLNKLGLSRTWVQAIR